MTTQPAGKRLQELRAEAEAEAMRKLRDETIPSLESVIAGTSTGPKRDLLTEANILLRSILSE